MLFNSVTLAAVAALVAAKECAAKKSSDAPVSWETVYTPTPTAAVAAAAATAETTSPTSHVKGKAFDRMVIIWFENTDYDKSFWDPNFTYFASKGITLTNYYGVTHTSEPNYMAAVAGDYFGMPDDPFHRCPQNISSVIDLLEDRGVSWGEYQENMPFSGYEGYSYVNTETGANDYVRKHNPAVLMDSVTFSEERLSQIKNLSQIDRSRSEFHKDLNANELPQWMFITPNMTSDGHDTDVTVAGQWCRKFLDPLLENPNFMQNTLVLLTWDENHTYTDRNQVLGILLGDAVPDELVGTSDDNFYSHYSQIATVEANWDLATLGRWDVGANVFKVVGDKTGDQLRHWSNEDRFDQFFWNESYGGPFNYATPNPTFPAPNLALDDSFSGRKVSKSIQKTWKDSGAPTYYKDQIQFNDGLNPPKGYKPPTSS